MTGGVAGVILAGGLSRRLGGGDKCLSEVGGMTLLARIAARLRPQVTALALNANGDPARFADSGLEIIADPVEGHRGPLAGILAGMQWAADRPGCTHVVSVPGDTPFIPGDLVPRLLAANQGAENRIVVAASSGRRHPVIGLWPVNLAGALEAWLRAGHGKVAGFIDGRQHCDVDFSPVPWRGGTLDPFFNINTAEDLELARQYLAEAS